jgi:hypothetical protein
MEHFKNYFRTEDEVYKFFGGEVFKFSFMSDNTIFFKTLQPRIIDDVLYSFEISFYHESGMDFFCYSSFDSYLHQMQIHQVDVICDLDNDRETMYFRRFFDYRDN